MTRLPTVVASLLTGLALIIVTGLSACSGAVGGSPPVTDPTRITILPAGTSTAPVTAYSGLPTTFTISGGTGAYIVSSDNQSIVAVSGSVNGSSLTIVPNPVIADTTVTITVRDTGTAPTASTVVTVKPGTVNNSITLTPTSSAPSCTPAYCSGTDALLSTTISQGGIPLAARGVRFDVVAGTFSFVQTDPTTLATTLVNTIQVATDETGKAVARVRIPPGAQNQTALAQITDIATGTFRRFSFAIAQSNGSSPGFAIIPSSVVFQGAITGQCANSNIFAELMIVGGLPPYTISGGGNIFQVNPSVVTSSGGHVDVTPTGFCSPAPGITITATDATGHIASATVENLQGTQTAPDLSVSPASVTLSSCGGAASASVAGGVSSTYFVSSGSDALDVSVFQGTISIQRHNPSAAVAGPLSIGVSDGASTKAITVNLTGEGAGTCPAIRASPASVTLNDCSTLVPVALSGGSGTYTAASSDATVLATISGSTLSIGRTSTANGVPGGSGTFAPPATVTVQNGSSQIAVTVNASVGGQTTCP